MTRFIVVSVLTAIACIAVIAYEVGYQNGALAQQDATGSMLALMGGSK